MQHVISSVIFIICLSGVAADGLLLLYRPRDISNECAFSRSLRYDLSFGMGMSDTITVVFRTLNEVDYECVVEIVTVSENVYIIVVIRFPGNVGLNCGANGDAFIVMKRNKCLHLCDLIDDRNVLSPYYVFTVKGRVRFSYLSNSSINTDINAHLYQVTATSARLKPKHGCKAKNESTCSLNGSDYCITSGVVCDGIKNCGVNDWFDERKSTCGLPVERLGIAPVITVIIIIICVLFAAGHILLQCLPPLAHSFFIFNANEDNRLCVDPVFKTPTQGIYDIEAAKRHSLIPVPSSSSSEQESINRVNTSNILKQDWPSGNKESQPVPKRKTTMRYMTKKIQQKLKLVTGKSRNSITNPLSSSEN